MSLTDGNELQTRVAPASNILRGTHTHASGKEAANLRVHDLAAELDLHIQPGPTEFTLRLDSDAGEFASIVCSNRENTREIRVSNFTAPLPGLAGSPVHLHIFLDGSVLELRANDTTFLTARAPPAPDWPSTPQNGRKREPRFCRRMANERHLQRPPDEPILQIKPAARRDVACYV